MNTTLSVIDRIKSSHNVESDYAVAKLLSVSKQAISKYRNRGQQFDDSVAFRAAKLIKSDPAELLANLHIERAANDDELKAWKTIEAKNKALKSLNKKEYLESIDALLAGNATEKQKKLVKKNRSLYIMLNRLY